MKFLNKVLIATLCSTAMTAPVLAQESDAQATDDNIIIVTATRRAQDVQDIPLAVTAVSPVEMERQGVVNVENIGSVSPSFSTSSAQIASGSVVLRIRGVGTTSNNIGFESAVGIFVDGAYQSRPGVALGEFVDVERVEVLRGPQGTLFGRNTSAGALNITNKSPDLSEFGGFVNATYGNYDHMNIQGAVNAPLVQDTLALRVTGAYRKRDGFIDLIDSAGKKFGESNNVDQYLLRGQLGFEGDSGIRARLIVDYSKSTASCCVSVEVKRSSIETRGSFTNVGLGARGGMFAPSAAVGNTDTTAVQRAVDNLVASPSFQPTNSNDQWGVTGEIEFPLSDSADIIYIGSYREYSASEVYDTDFAALDIFNVLPGGGTNIDTMTHELRIQGDAFDGALDWLVGAYYSTEDINQTVKFGLGKDYGEMIGAIFNLSTTSPFTANPLTHFTNSDKFPGTPLAVAGGIDPSVIRVANAYTQNSKSFSVFTHNTLEVTDGLKFTIGLRYSKENKDGSFSQPSITNPLCPAILASVGAGNVPAGFVPGMLGLGCFAFTAPAIGKDGDAFPLPRPFASKFKDDELIYTGKVSYEFVAPVTAYASFTHGYKSGGFNLDSTAASGGADPRFRSETVDAYELGVKAKLLDDAVTLNIAAFLEKFQDFQVLEFTGTQFKTFNVPKAQTSGLEIETVIRPSDHLTFNGGLTLTDAKYPNDCAGTETAASIHNLCGFPLTNAPKTVGIVGATYKNDINDNLNFFLNGQIRFEGDRRTTTQPRVVPNAAAIAAAGSVQKAVAAAMLTPYDVQDSNVKINLRAGIGGPDEIWGIEAWVTNLTNQITRAVTYNTVLRGDGRSAYIQQPRMFGVTLRGKF